MHFVKSALVALGVLAIAAIAPAAAFAPGQQVDAGLPVISIVKNNGGGSPRAGYDNCSGLQCTCTGDAQCNEMFESGVCGDIATCEETTGVCKCLKAKRVQGTKNKAPIKGVKNPVKNIQN